VIISTLDSNDLLTRMIYLLVIISVWITDFLLMPSLRVLTEPINEVSDDNARSLRIKMTNLGL
jgi:hypothetical protein